MPTIYKIIILSLLVTFIILLASKTEIRYKVRDYFDVIADKYKCEHIRLISKMLDCDFCFSFWLSLLVSSIFATFTADLNWLYIPFLSTPLTRFLL